MENVGTFYGHLEYFTANWYILWPFNNVVVIWFILFFFTFLVFCVIKNLATLVKYQLASSISAALIGQQSKKAFSLMRASLKRNHFLLNISKKIFKKSQKISKKSQNK
jgi:uncharacterized metal-binding protein